MQVIQHQELASAQASFEFTSIPQIFTDLYVAFSLRNDRGVGATSYAGLTINGNYTNLSQRILDGNGSVANSYTYTSGTYPVFFYIPGSHYTASTFGNGGIYIPNYAGSTAKSISVDCVSENNSTTAYQTLQAALYNSSTAITSLGFISLNSELGAAGNLVQYCSATLYGITKGTSNGVTVS